MTGCGCGCGSKGKSSGCGDGEEKQILQALANSDKPCGSKEIATATGLDSKVVSAKISELKKQGYVDSPVRCKYGMTANGKAVL